jgi:hypothetical protein
MKIIYIAGPFRANTNWLIQKNVRRSEEKTLEIWKSGNVPVTPHLLGKNFYGELHEGKVLQGLLKLLKRCDGMLLLPGWKDSNGTMAEVGCCCYHNIPYDTDLEQLLKKIDNDKNQI